MASPSCLHLEYAVCAGLNQEPVLLVDRTLTDKMAWYHKLIQEEKTQNEKGESGVDCQEYCSASHGRDLTSRASSQAKYGDNPTRCPVMKAPQQPQHHRRDPRLLVRAIYFRNRQSALSMSNPGDVSAYRRLSQPLNSEVIEPNEAPDNVLSDFGSKLLSIVPPCM